MKSPTKTENEKHEMNFNIPTLSANGDYQQWLHLVKSLLREKNLWAAINTARPAEREPLVEWQMSNESAIGLISRHVSAELMDEIVEPETAVLLLRVLQNHLDSRKGDRKRAAKEWLANAKYSGGEIKPLLDEMDRQFRILEKCDSQMDDEEKGYTLMRLIPSTKDRKYEGLKSTLSSALIRGEPYDSMARLVTHEVTRINAEYQDLPQVHFADARKRPFQFKKRPPFKNQRRPTDPKTRPQIKRCTWCGRPNHAIEKCRSKELYEKHQASVNIAIAATASSSEQEVSRNKNGYIKFILDSGASHHLIHCDQLAENFPALHNPIKIMVAGKNQFILATKMGTLYIRTELGFEIALEDVLFCNEATLNIISLNKLRKNGFSIFSWPTESKIFKDQMLVSEIDDLGTLLYLDWEVITCSSLFTCNIAQSDAEFALWHRRLGHLCNDKLKQIIKNNLFKDTKVIQNLITDKSACTLCTSQADEDSHK